MWGEGVWCVYICRCVYLFVILIGYKEYEKRRREGEKEWRVKRGEYEGRGRGEEGKIRGEEEGKEGGGGGGGRRGGVRGRGELEIGF